MRRYNDLPPVGHAKVGFGLPSTTSHLHNAHTASESDGNPVDWIDSGEFWDHHYGNFPAGHDPLQKLTTLWYHDHRLDFTAANVYAGLAGFYCLFDEDDTGDENTGWHLPSFPKYDIPLILQDIRFAETPAGAQVVFDAWNTDGMLGDRMTVNRRITPRFNVEPRKYRFRILNGGPSRFYELFLRSSRAESRRLQYPRFTVITGDGNFLPEPVETESVFLGVAQRTDVILDFSGYKPGDHVYLHNLLQQLNGAGPTGAYMKFDDPESNLLRFDVVPLTAPDNSRVPDQFRPWPRIDLSKVKRERIWTFDYEGGLWTINDRVMDPNRVDAGIDQGSAEIWTFRNGGRNWSHPIHSHFVEFLFLEINGRPYRETYIQDISGLDADGRDLDLKAVLGKAPGARSPVDTFMGGRRRDVAILLPSDELQGLHDLARLPGQIRDALPQRRPRGPRDDDPLGHRGAGKRFRSAALRGRGVRAAAREPAARGDPAGQPGAGGRSVAAAGAAEGEMIMNDRQADRPDDCRRPARGPDAGRIPNHAVVTHEGFRALFYDDLILGQAPAGKTVILHCMSIATEPTYRTVESLARVRSLAAGRLGRDLFFYSLTVDPERDTPKALREFAASHGTGPGWLFLTGEAAALTDLRQRLFSHGPGHVHGMEGADCAMAMLRYGNAAAGLWGAVPARTDPSWIVQRLSWIESREHPVGPPRRRGPAPLRA